MGQTVPALIGVPMDLGVTNRAGARLGPRAVRAVERIGPYEHALKLAPASRLRFADTGIITLADLRAAPGTEDLVTLLADGTPGFVMPTA